MPADLSACMVTYHCGEEIDHAMRCLENADLEVAVWLCDNSPEDITAERVQWKFPGVNVLPQQENLGFCRANNAVLPFLQSRYHLLMHPDVNFDPSLLSRMTAYMDAHPSICVLIPRVLSEDGEEQFCPKKQLTLRALLGCMLYRLGNPFRRWRNDYTLASLDVRVPVPVECANGCFLLVRTSVFRRLEGFDPRFFQFMGDDDFCRRIRSSGLGSIVFHPGFHVTHLRLRGSVPTFNSRMRQIRAVLRYFRKWGISW